MPKIAIPTACGPVAYSYTVRKAKPSPASGMGRRESREWDAPPDPAEPMTAGLVRLCQGYDHGGVYWGGSDGTLYHVTGYDLEGYAWEWYTRARSVAEALAEAIALIGIQWDHLLTETSRSPWRAVLSDIQYNKQG